MRSMFELKKETCSATICYLTGTDPWVRTCTKRSSWAGRNQRFSGYTKQGIAMAWRRFALLARLFRVRGDPTCPLDRVSGWGERSKRPGREAIDDWRGGSPSPCGTIALFVQAGAGTAILPIYSFLSNARQRARRRLVHDFPGILVIAMK